MNSEAKSLGQQLHIQRVEGRTSLHQVYHIKLSVVLHKVGLIQQKKVGWDNFMGTKQPTVFRNLPFLFQGKKIQTGLRNWTPSVSSADGLFANQRQGFGGTVPLAVPTHTAHKTCWSLLFLPPLLQALTLLQKILSRSSQQDKRAATQALSSIYLLQAPACRISAREDEFLEGDGICFERKGETSLHFCYLLIKADGSVFGLETLFCMYSTTQTQCRYSQCR